MLVKITEEQSRQMMSMKDIPGHIRAASDKVAVVLTQSWCPQWMAMKLWLNRLGKKHKTLHVYYLEYDKESCFQEFMHFKETHLNNQLVPYVRYYNEGEYMGDSNFCGEEYFREQLGLI